MLHDRLRLVYAVKHGGGLLLIALGVQLVFNGHGAGDAADIQVGVHGAVVRAAADLAEGHGVDVLVGGVLKNIRGVGIRHIDKDIQA